MNFKKKFCCRSLPYLYTYPNDYYYYQDISNFNEYATSLWIDPPVNPRLKIYVFNFTNPDEFLTGAKPKFEELGPYVFS